MKKYKKVHIVWADWETLLCDKELRSHDDYLTIGAYDRIIGHSPTICLEICSHCLRKYNKMKESE